MCDNAGPHPELAVRRRERRGPSRGFWIGMLGVLLFALALTLVSAVAAARNPGRSDGGTMPQDVPAPTVVVSHAPRLTTPPDNIALNR